MKRDKALQERTSFGSQSVQDFGYVFGGGAVVAVRAYKIPFKDAQAVPVLAFIFRANESNNAFKYTTAYLSRADLPRLKQVLDSVQNRLKLWRSLPHQARSEFFDIQQDPASFSDSQPSYFVRYQLLSDVDRLPRDEGKIISARFYLRQYSVSLDDVASITRFNQITRKAISWLNQ